jgi:aminoglycoside phosphotransferase
LSDYRDHKKNYLKLLHGGACLPNIPKCSNGKYFNDMTNQCCDD